VAPDDSPAATLAGVMLREQLQLKKDENLIVETWNHTLPYAAACVVEARRIGAHPVMVLEDEGAYFRSLQIGASTASWARVGTHEWALLSKTHAYVFFPGPSDRGMIDTLGPTQRQGIPSANQEWVRRARSARVRGVRSVLGYASEPEAERYGVTLATWRSQLIAGTTQADLPAMKNDAQRVRAALKTGKVLRITAANGTDFQVRLRGREPYADDGVVRPDDVSAGRIMTTAPPGYVGVAIDEHSAEGMAIANRPSFLLSGRVEGGQWEMQEGHLTNFWYTEGQSVFENGYSKAGKGRDVISFVSVGINSALPPGVPRVEDQEAGTVALGVGGNVPWGGSNRCPFVSYIVMGEATIAVDGKPLLDRGKVL
jgi:leucyl aminopeptidase (aminopeptidase T)